MRKSITEIANENNVRPETIKKYLIQHGIEYWTTPKSELYPPGVVDQWEKLYCEDKYSTYKIGQMFKVSHRLVSRYLEKRGVHIRGLSEAQFVSKGKEVPPELFDAELLNKWHWEDNMSCKDIGNKIGIEAGTVRRHMQQLGLKTKNNSECKIGLLTGENHPNWRGGRTPFKMLLREFFHVNQAPEILARDNYHCQLCGKTHVALHVHHIVHFNDIVNAIIDEHPDLDPTDADDQRVLYDIVTKDPRFLDKDNLITYCRDCHLFKIHKLKRKTISSQASEEEEGSETILNEEYTVSD